MTATSHKAVTTNEEVAGKIAGFSHVVMICRDMGETVAFYRDLLGLKLVVTKGRASNEARDAADSQDDRLKGNHKRSFTRQYFFELGNGEGFGFYEVPDSPSAIEEDTALGYWYWPGTADTAPLRPRKLDHLAFHVERREDVDFLAKRLTEHGVDVTGPFAEAKGSPGLYTYRIYFYDPSGNPLEIATLADKRVDTSVYFQDTEPPPSVLAS